MIALNMPVINSVLAVTFRFIILSLLFIHYSTNNKIVATKYGLNMKINHLIILGHISTFSSHSLRNCYNIAPYSITQEQRH